MLEFGKAAFIGICIGLVWGIGCSLVLLYSIYLAGYKKAIKDSLEPDKNPRYREIVARMRSAHSPHTP